jgi:cobalt-zinc-cadmium resistance protein CzcA
MDLPQLIELAINNNAQLKASALSVDRQQELVREGYNWDRTRLFYSYDENNIAENGNAIRVWGLSQSFAFPTVYSATRQSLLADVSRKQSEYELNLYMLKKKVSRSFYETAYLMALQERYAYLDSLYSNFARAARRRFETGESNYLERVTAEAKMKETELMLKQNKQELESSYARLRSHVQIDSIITLDPNAFPKSGYSFQRQLEGHPGLQIYTSFEETALWRTRAEKNKLLPDLSLSYFQGTNNFSDARIYRGFEVGIALPIFYGTQKGMIRAGQIEQNIYASERENYRLRLEAEQTILLSRLEKAHQALEYYDESGRDLIAEIVRASQRSYQEGEINYFQYIQSLDNALRLELNYLENLLEYNLTVVDLQYLTIEP